MDASIGSHFERLEVILTIIAVILLVATIICIGCCLTICISIGVAYKQKQKDEMAMRRQILEIRDQNIPRFNPYDKSKVLIIAGNNSRNGKSLMLKEDEIEQFRTLHPVGESEDSI